MCHETPILNNWALTCLPTVQGFPVQYREFSDLAVLYRELLHLYRDLSLEKINDCESNNV